LTHISEVSIETEGKKSEKMLVLFETPAGYAVFKLLDEKRIQQSDNLYEDFETVESAKNVVKLKCFQKFEDTTEALAAATAAVEGKMSKSLKKMLKKIGKWTLILMLFCF
jgi:nucleolar protein 58